MDTNISMPENNWTYANSLKTTIEIKDANKAYRVYFKLRHTSSYRYANLYVIMHLKGEGLNKHTRYQFKVAKTNGEWLGKGSGDIFTNTFPLLNTVKFPKPGKYLIEIEQNMRDNPLVGISDVGLTVELKEE
jgi:gliding motility-associated lipoprotein GldH